MLDFYYSYAKGSSEEQRRTRELMTLGEGGNWDRITENDNSNCRKLLTEKFENQKLKLNNKEKLLISSKILKKKKILKYKRKEIFLIKWKTNKKFLEGI